jgi:SAM-dependent methyltransferase
MSLELARNGCDVTGIDLSGKCIEIAGDVAAKDPWMDERGPLRYVQGNFLTDDIFAANSFDAVVFIGALHHFPDQDKVAKRVVSILDHDGIILVHEPTRDRMSRGNAAFIHLVRLLLSQGKGFYTEIPVPGDEQEYRQQVNSIYAEMRYEDESGGKMQSVNDNEAGFSEMTVTLGRFFTQLDFRERYAFFHEMIGGLRFNEQQNTQLAWYLRCADAELCRSGVLQPTEFFYVGRKAESR